MSSREDDFRAIERAGYAGPSMEEIAIGIQRKITGWGGKRVSLILLLIALGVWLASGIYIVGPGEMGVIRQFGKEMDQTSPGLRYRFPWPIQTHDVVHLARVRRAAIGLRTDPSGKVSPEPREALMLTGDENIVDAQLFVQYVVKNPSQFLFRVRQPEPVLKASAEVALRSVAGRNTIDYMRSFIRSSGGFKLMNNSLRERRRFFWNRIPTFSSISKVLGGRVNDIFL